MGSIKVIVTGAAGKMGQAVMKGVLNDPDCLLVGGVDVKNEGKELGEILGTEDLGTKMEKDLTEAIEKLKPDVMVDFTHAGAAKNNIKIALQSNVYPIIGTTGLKDEDMEEIHTLCEENNTGAFFAPNFALGAVLLMQCAGIIAKHMPSSEIIELHHDQKLDAPSGTALRTAEIIASQRESSTGKTAEKDVIYEKVEGCRGGNHEGVNVHSVRLPGLVAHQEVIFGGLGQTLKIRHDSISRDSFIPGVLLAIKNAPKRKGVVVGLESFLDV